MSSRIAAPVAESRLPVGSSASTIAGSLTSARAIATRCCSPPERVLGRWCRRSASPMRSSTARARRSRCRAGNARVDERLGDVLERGQRLEQEELLEHEPDAVRAQARQLAVGQLARVHPGDLDDARRSGGRACP